MSRIEPRFQEVRRRWLPACRAALHPSRPDPDLAGIDERDAVTDTLNHPRSRARTEA